MGTCPVTLPVALTIAGVDSSGGAGVSADLATFAAEGVWGACAVTALTAQNSLGVDAIEFVAIEMIVAQITAVVRDMRVGAAKTGMLGSADVARAVPQEEVDAAYTLGAGRLRVLRKVILPHSWPGIVDVARINLAAGWLIEHASPPEGGSWKGFRRGDVGCYPHQALVLVNYGNASGPEVWQFGQEIIASVAEKFGVILEPEVNIVGKRE